LDDEAIEALIDNAIATAKQKNEKAKLKTLAMVKKGFVDAGIVGIDEAIEGLYKRFGGAEEITSEKSIRDKSQDNTTKRTSRKKVQIPKKKNDDMQLRSSIKPRCLFF